MSKTKRFALAGILLFISTLLISCAQAASPSDNEDNNSKDSTEKLYTFTSKLPSYYKVSLSISSDNEDETTLTFVKNAKGYQYNNNIFYKLKDDYYKFQLEDNKVTYTKQTETNEKIASYQTEITGYLQAYDEIQDKLKKGQTEKIAGRDCTKYSSSKLTIWIDNEYEVCMKYTCSTNDSNTEWVVTELKTSEVSLPEADYEQLIEDSKQEELDTPREVFYELFPVSDDDGNTCTISISELGVLGFKEGIDYEISDNIILLTDAGYELWKETFNSNNDDPDEDDDPEDGEVEYYLAYKGEIIKDGVSSEWLYPWTEEDLEYEGFIEGEHYTLDKVNNLVNLTEEGYEYLLELESDDDLYSVSYNGEILTDYFDLTYLIIFGFEEDIDYTLDEENMCIILLTEDAYNFYLMYYGF